MIGIVELIFRAKKQPSEPFFFIFQLPLSHIPLIFYIHIILFFLPFLHVISTITKHHIGQKKYISFGLKASASASASRFYALPLLHSALLKYINRLNRISTNCQFTR